MKHGLFSDMKMSLGKVRSLVMEVAAGPAYQRKEEVRSLIEAMIKDAVARGNVASQGDLDDLLATADMALKALRMVPFEVWQATSAKKTGKRR